MGIEMIAYISYSFLNDIGDEILLAKVDDSLDKEDEDHGQGNEI